MTIKVVVADDHKLFRQGLIGLMHAYDDLVEVVGEAATGREAVQLARRLRPDVVLMDIQMPEMDGITATQEIFKLYAGRTRPYISAMTAYAMKGDREKLLQAGMDDYISKPVRLESLTAALKNYIYQKKS